MISRSVTATTVLSATFAAAIVFGGGAYAQCGSSTPSFTANLSGTPNGTWTSPSIVRADTCCGSTAPDKCLKFTILLDPNAIGINFQIVSGAPPPGALFYQINCGPPVAVGSPICLSGAGPHVLTFCKPGSNSNIYGITSIPKPSVPDSILVRNGCTQTLSVSGFSVPTINWTSVPASTLYNSYLSCTSGCATVVVTPTGTPPPYVDYEVSGYAASPCQASFFRDTVRVYYYTDLAAAITPSNPTICYGSNSAVLTVTASGGKPAYTYSWTSGSTQQTATVGVGTYTAFVSDATGCPPTQATVTVNQFTLPIDANAGSDKTVCKSSPNVSLAGTVAIATGGVWSGGGGTFLPSASSLTTTYVPTAGEVNTGSVQVYLTTTGNAGCLPDVDTLKITFQPPPTINAGADATVCANNSQAPLSATVNGYPATVIWLSQGTGTFSALSQSSTVYSPSAADIASGSVTIVATTSGNGACPAASDTVLLSIAPKPAVNAGADFTICSNSSATLSGGVSLSSSTGSWSTSGDGTFSNPSSLSTTYAPGASDILTGTVNIVLTSTSNSFSCLPVRDTVRLTINKIASVTATSLSPVCSLSATVPLTATITGAALSGTWSTNGSGTLSSLSNSAAAYALSAADRLSNGISFTVTSVNNGMCPAVSSSFFMGIVPPATVNAGSNQPICSTQSTISLAAGSPTITGPSPGSLWTSSGTGTFANAANILTTYSVSAADVNTGFVTFTLASTASVCPAVADTVQIRIVKKAAVTASAQPAICSNAPSISLTGTVVNMLNTGVWSTNGAGSFNPNSTSLLTTYSVQPSDIAAGTVNFTLTSSNDGPCGATTNTLQVTIVPIATVNAGSNQLVCSAQQSITLSGQVLGAAGTGSWSGGSGVFLPAGNPSTTYSIGPADITAGTVVFALASTGNSVCPQVADTVTVKITKQPVTIAGPSMSICSTTSMVPLSGTVTGSSNTGVWLTSGSGAFSPSNTFLTTGYVIGNNDVANGTVLLTLSSTNNFPCQEKQDTLRVTIASPETVNTGSYGPICSSAKQFSLNGTVTGGRQTAVWWSSGNGTFVPSPADPAVVYSISPADIFNGAVTLSLTSTNNGACPVSAQTVTVGIRQQPTVTAVPDQTICSSNSIVSLSGTVTGVTSSGVWTTDASGSFAPSNTSIVNNYQLSATDLAAGTIHFALTSTNNDVCAPAVDSVTVKIVTNPIVTMRSDTTICSASGRIRLYPVLTGGSGEVLWQSSGTGTFIPNSFIPNASYALSSQDVQSGNVLLKFSSVHNGPCGSVGSSTTVKINPSPQAAFTSSSYSLTLPADPIVLTNSSQGADTYLWDFGDHTTATSISPVKKFSEAGYYTITLIAKNQYDCSDTTDALITVVSTVRAPTAFTPNGDNLNDIFYVYTSGVVEFEMMIFNRWGELIFRSDDLKNGWDGTFNGKMCQQDAYVWKAKMKFFDGRTFSQTGSITLLR